MEERIVNFIAALRAAGVRISLAESQDAWRAIETMGIGDREKFRVALRTTLVKEADDLAKFEELFPVYFGSGTPPLNNPQEELSPEEQQMLQDAVQDLADELRQLLQWLLNGQNPSQEELQELAQQAGIDRADSPQQAQMYARRMQRLLGWQYLQELLEMLFELLAQQGMDPEKIEQLKAKISENQQLLKGKLEEFAGQQIRENMIEESQQRRQSLQDLMERPLNNLSPSEKDLLRGEVRRLAARLRSRVALRYRRGKTGKLDAKSTLRANQRYGGVPFDVRYKLHRLKPKLVTFVDLSTSMLPVTEFFLWLLYELQDQIQKSRSFAFIDHLEDVTTTLNTLRPDEAMRDILVRLPPGHYNTDLGTSLGQFEERYLDTVDRRTTVIVLGDARNNYNDPRLDILLNLQRRARRVIWLNPEYPAQWGTGDSDMLKYAMACSEVFQVRNLAQLTEAIDRMLN